MTRQYTLYVEALLDIMDHTVTECYTTLQGFLHGNDCFVAIIAQRLPLVTANMTGGTSNSRFAIGSPLLLAVLYIAMVVAGIFGSCANLLGT